MVCLDGVAPDEALDHRLTALRSRLGNDPEEERAVAAEELRRLARGRLTRLTLRPARATAGNPGGNTAQTATEAATQAVAGHSRPDSPYVPV